MNQKDFKNLIDQLAKSSNRKHWLLGIILVIVVAIFVPEYLTGPKPTFQPTNVVSTSQIEQFNGYNFGVFDDLTFIPCELLDVIDGDTIKVSINNQPVRVRYLMIDSPEMNFRKSQPPEPFAQDALDYNQKLLENAQTIYLQMDVGHYTDRYQRLLAYVYADDEMVNASLLEAGLATVRYVDPPNNTYEEYLRNIEAQAKKNLVGQWSY